MAQKLQQQLREVGSKLETPPSTKDALVKLLKQATTCLSELDQSPSASILESMQPFLNAIVKPELLKHQDRDVKLLVATCICEITRITAPEAPYSDDVLKDIFCLIVSTFSGLSDTKGPSFGRRVVILETLAKYRSCVVMLDLECDDLVNEMISTFFAVASDDHPESVLSSMQTIMVVLLEESEDVREDLLFVILSILGRNKSDVTMAARRLAMNVIEHCAGKLEAGIKQFLISSMSGDNRSVNSQIDYHEVIYDIYRCAPQILLGVVPYLTGELLTDQLDTRLKAVRLVGDLFALPGSAISEAFQPIFSEFLKRLTDRLVEVRMCVLEHVKSCFLSNPLRAETPQIISALCDRLLDFDENVRKQVVAVICDVACHALDAIPLETVKLVAERLRDKSLLVKKYTMERLAEINRVYCVKCSDGLINPDDFDWIPGKILRCFYDKDFRSDTIESVLCGSLFPIESSVKDKVKHWVRIFSGFDKVEVKALEKILEQKQRLQQEMQRYLSLRQMNQDGDAPEIQKKVLFCFRIMSRSFADPAKAEENYQILDQLKDANIWKILTNLVDPNTGFHQACTFRDDLLRILGEKHRLYDFLSNLSVKCSYLLFNKEHVKEILLEAATHKSAGNTQYTQSCMDILVLLARFSPMLLGGVEGELVIFLKDDDEIIKEGVLHVLAKAGGTIREQLAVSSSSIDLVLERLCLEGSRRQAKYAVHALAAITKDDGLKSLSVLYKRLVDMLEEKTHLPAVLQSLGCIAETAMPVFETRESEIEDFIMNKILKCSNKAEDDTSASWDDRSELCLLKIFGIKTLVKSYLPVKDAHVRPAIDGLLDILRNVLSFGEISKDIESSFVDKAHLRLASAKAVLRLSKYWDDKIPVDIFHLTLRTSEISFPQAKKLFLGKVHQYIKDRHLDGKYACAFLFNIIGSEQSEFEEEKQNLADIIQMYHQAKARQLSTQSDGNSLTAYPEYILPYLVHALAQHSCPNIDECKDVKAFELIYRKLYLIISMLVHRDEDTKSEASSNKEKDRESISIISSIFQSIKCSEDIVDTAKSKNSHAICDLGLSITKRLAPKEDDLQGLTASVPLPSVLYKLFEKKEGDDSVARDGQTWLADENILTHFESLKLETDEEVFTEVAQDEELKHGEIDGNEIPLGKMMKSLKSQGTKAKKVKKKKSLPAEAKNAENDVDILKMVREINFENMGMSSKFESSNGHEHFPSKKTKKDREDEKGKKRKASDATSFPVPKRPRSSSTHSAFRSPASTSKATLRASGNDSHKARISSFQSVETDPDISSDTKDKISMRKKMVEGSESDLLLSCIRKKTSFSSKDKGRYSDRGHNDEVNEVGEASDHDMEKPNVLTETDKINTNSNVKSPMGSSRKRKRRSIAGLAKCTSKAGGRDIEDLIGCRIKVWWPMDKKFYQGTVKSYDPLKGKHVVLYEDGDVEVLRLEKERWELIDNGRKSSKKLNSSNGPPSKEVSPGKKKKNSSGSVWNKESTQIVKGKRTPKKNLKHGRKGVSKSDLGEAEDRGNSDIPSPEPTSVSKADELNSGDSEGEQAERLDENLTDKEESEKEVKSVSKIKQLKDTEKSLHHTDESDGEENPDLEGRSAGDITEKSLHHTDESDGEENPDLEGRSAGDITEKSPHHTDESDGEENPDFEGRSTGDIECVPQDSPISDEEKSGSEDKEADESSSAGKEGASEEDKSDSEGSQASRSISRKKEKPSDVRDAEISDDEPLMKWKHRAAKTSSRR
ncbi:sister chromatid cohesion protein PDS5 homolog A [Alnus glutinosa]|uniref:sister chromatid cohesion protein PDS5 homolog A n=1 Tax=Alnus glutinosa TaxID=3517 RepID=UPI002D768980|nr:sister chromatid cohesion protein PDS5 homolog A [Alnus glutinosa]